MLLPILMFEVVVGGHGGQNGQSGLCGMIATFLINTSTQST